MSEMQQKTKARAKPDKNGSLALTSKRCDEDATLSET